MRATESGVSHHHLLSAGTEDWLQTKTKREQRRLRTFSWQKQYFADFVKQQRKCFAMRTAQRMMHTTSGQPLS